MKTTNVFAALDSDNDDASGNSDSGEDDEDEDDSDDGERSRSDSSSDNTGSCRINKEDMSPTAASQNPTLLLNSQEVKSKSNQQWREDSPASDEV